MGIIMSENHGNLLLSDMKFDDLIREFSEKPFFELGDVRQISSRSEGALKNQLSRWVKQGKLIRLRREKYLLGSDYRKFTPSTYYIANYLYRPSYVSIASALQYYDLIPEAVAEVQSVTPKHGREWGTDLGRFEYRSIKQDRFWGYREDVLDQLPDQNWFFIAEPEKAILDLMYFGNGEWTGERLSQMRFQGLDNINVTRFREYSEKFDSPRLKRAVERFLDLHKGELGE